MGDRCFEWIGRFIPEISLREDGLLGIKVIMMMRWAVVLALVLRIQHTDAGLAYDDKASLEEDECVASATGETGRRSVRGLCCRYIIFFFPIMN